LIFGPNNCVEFNELKINLHFFNYSRLQNGIAPNYIQKPVIKPDADGKRISFECRIKADPEPELFWFRDNIPIDNKGRCLIFCDKLPDNVYFACLEIDDVSAEDAGKYRVTAKNSLGESNATITLNFDSETAGSGTGNAPLFIQKPFIRQLEDKVLFECKLTADPVPTFDWYLGSSQLKNASKYKQRIISEGMTHTFILEINNLVAKDSGDYKLIAKNQHGQADANIKLNIETKVGKLPEGVAPHFLSKPKVTQTNDNLLIELELEANPTPSASWYLDTKDLNESADARFVTAIKKSGANSYVLSLNITKPKNSDAGLYKCIVLNELGECIANIFLQFQGDKAGVGKGDQIPPTILEKPKIIKDESKRTVRIEVRMRAKPDATITWFKEKQTLKSDNKKWKIDMKKESNNEFTLILEILDFSPNDGGLYKVQAKNESGQSNANIHLNVDVQQAAPIFIGIPKLVSDNGGKRIIIECRCESAEGAPQIIWLKDGTQLKNEGRHLIDVETVDKTHFLIILEIDQVVDSDAGAYKCVAKNGAGEGATTITVKTEGYLFKLI
jgi:hypothetical protein